MRAYPTFLFLDGDGKEIHRIVGGDSDADKFLKSVDDGIGTLSLSSLAKRYEGGERDTTFLLSYLKALDGAYDSKKPMKWQEYFWRAEIRICLQIKACLMPS